jgi:N-acetylglucosamine-6-phosphate deacetylase
MNRTLLCHGPEGWGPYTVDFSGDSVVLSRSDADPDGVLCPGFVDIHIHGAFGIDFMSASTEDLITLCHKLREIGYEGFLPTTVTAPASDVKSALNRLPDDPLVWGFHLEGPFISPKHPGAQPPSAIVEPPQEPSEWDEILDDSRLKVITMAPEQPGALKLASRLSSRGVLVSMGHTDATFDQAAIGFEAGFGHSTHTYNAMRGLHHREAGTVGFCLLADGLSCELIYDRIHVSQPAAQILINSKPAHKILAVSDSTLASGTAKGQTFDMWGTEVVRGENDIRLKRNGALAGSSITMLDAFQNLASDFGPELAVRACSLNPRKAIGHFGTPSTWIEFDNSFAIRSIHKAASLG